MLVHSLIMAPLEEVSVLRTKQILPLPLPLIPSKSVELSLQEEVGVEPCTPLLPRRTLEETQEWQTEPARPKPSQRTSKCCLVQQWLLAMLLRRAFDQQANQEV